MDKKNIAIVILVIAFLITLVGLISTSARVRKIVAEKDEFIEKIKETDNLAVELNKNVADLKAMLGRVTKEKEKAENESRKNAEQAGEMKKRLEQISKEKVEEKQEIPQ